MNDAPINGISIKILQRKSLARNRTVPNKSNRFHLWLADCWPFPPYPCLAKIFENFTHLNGNRFMLEWALSVKMQFEIYTRFLLGLHLFARVRFQQIIKSVRVKMTIWNCWKIIDYIDFDCTPLDEFFTGQIIISVVDWRFLCWPHWWSILTSKSRI